MALRKPISLRLTSAFAVALALAACGQVPTGQAENAAFVDANALPPLPDSLPLSNETPEDALAYAPAAENLPAPAQPVSYGRVAQPQESYGYIDRAASFDDAIGDAPPDYGYYYDDEVEPWAWRGHDDSAYFAEPIYDGGYRSYYYEAGYDKPYLIRDPWYSYGFDDGRLVSVYDSYGVLLPIARWPRNDYYARYYHRGIGLHRASLRDRRPVYASRWSNQRRWLSAQRTRWVQTRARQPEWRSYHTSRAPRVANYWRDERVLRRAETRRFDQWQARDFRGPRPALVQPAGTVQRNRLIAARAREEQRQTRQMRQAEVARDRAVARQQRAVVERRPAAVERRQDAQRRQALITRQRAETRDDRGNVARQQNERRVAQLRQRQERQQAQRSNPAAIAQQRQAERGQARQQAARQQIEQRQARQVQARQQARQGATERARAQQTPARQARPAQVKAQQAQARQNEARQAQARQTKAREDRVRQTRANQTQARANATQRQTEARQAQSRRTEARQAQQQQQARARAVQRQEVRQPQRETRRPVVERQPQRQVERASTPRPERRVERVQARSEARQERRQAVERQPQRQVERTPVARPEPRRVERAQPSPARAEARQARQSSPSQPRSANRPERKERDRR